ncbi:MAG: hypothetical protein DMG07_13625, partial [Acidobacteria bacterium]
MESAFHREPSTTGSDSALLTVDIDDRYNPTHGQAFDLLQGTFGLLILRTLELQPLHGVAIADRIEQVTRGVFVVGPGSLFPALHRLAERRAGQRRRRHADPIRAAGRLEGKQGPGS